MTAQEPRLFAASDEALREALVAFVDDPLRFATDPDGDCWLCGEPTDPEDHDQDDEQDCPVTVARRVLAALPSPDRDRLAALPTTQSWAIAYDHEEPRERAFHVTVYIVASAGIVKDGYGPTPEAAIAAALGDPSGDRS